MQKSENSECVKVAVRCRPLVKKEIEADAAALSKLNQKWKETVSVIPKNGQIFVPKPQKNQVVLIRKNELRSHLTILLEKIALRLNYMISVVELSLIVSWKVSIVLSLLMDKLEQAKPILWKVEKENK